MAGDDVAGPERRATRCRLTGDLPQSRYPAGPCAKRKRLLDRPDLCPGRSSDRLPGGPHMRRGGRGPACDLLCGPQRW
jgi:hypothetical protein